MKKRNSICDTFLSKSFVTFQNWRSLTQKYFLSQNQREKILFPNLKFECVILKVFFYKQVCKKRLWFCLSLIPVKSFKRQFKLFFPLSTDPHTSLPLLEKFFSSTLLLILFNREIKCVRESFYFSECSNYLCVCVCVSACVCDKCVYVQCESKREKGMFSGANPITDISLKKMNLESISLTFLDYVCDVTLFKVTHYQRKRNLFFD